MAVRRSVLGVLHLLGRQGVLLGQNVEPMDRRRSRPADVALPAGRHGDMFSGWTYVGHPGLIGDIATEDGEPALHAHAVLGRRDGSTVGGHLKRAIVWPTLEVIVTETPEHLRKRIDDETGLALITLDDATPGAGT
jgi:hypothetical protein